MKKILFVLSIIPILLFTSCEIPFSYQYSITYYLNGAEVKLSPSGYNYGDNFTLPEPQIVSSYTFDGWYEDIEYLSDKVTSISSLDSGNKVFYGKTIKNTEETKTDLEIVYDALIYDFNTELTKILNEIKVYEKQSDGSLVLLNNDQYTVDTDEYQVGKAGEFTFTFTYKDLVKTLNITIKDQNSELKKYEINDSLLKDVIGNMAYDPETKETYGITLGLPSIGNPKVLVIPVEFTNCKAPTNIVKNLETAFFGTSEETGWESLQSYYYKSSYGKLNIQGTVLEPFNTGHTTGYYDNLYKRYLYDLDAYYNYETDTYPDSVEYSIIKEALAYYDDQINYDDYDYNKDGYIDSIYLVYVNEYSMDDDSLWWAFTDEYFTEEEELYDNVEADFYMFCSYQFLFDEFHGKIINYNLETIIHETGHLLGLDDYYDYDDTTGPNGGIGGGDMMDYNVGDHNAYSKLLLGWISPYIVNGETTTINLSQFQKSGDVVIIFKEWKGTFFDEYLIIDFYTPNYLNYASAGEYGLFSTMGVRIYHVNAKLNDPEDCYSIFELTKYNNSYTSKRLITLIEADGQDDISKNGYAENSDLFQTGDEYSPSRWYDYSYCGFKIKVNSITSTNANITIEYK